MKYQLNGRKIPKDRISGATIIIVIVLCIMLAGFMVYASHYYGKKIRLETYRYDVWQVNADYRRDVRLGYRIEVIIPNKFMMHSSVVEIYKRKKP